MGAVAFIFLNVKRMGAVARTLITIDVSVFVALLGWGLAVNQQLSIFNSFFGPRRRTL